MLSPVATLVWASGGMSSTAERRMPICTVAEDTMEESRRWRMFMRLPIDGGGLSAAEGE